MSSKPTSSPAEITAQFPVNHEPFQSRVTQWMHACYGKNLSMEIAERNHEFFEKATALSRAADMTAKEAHQMVDYVFSRPAGEKFKRAGSVLVTLSALCSALGVNLQKAGESGLKRMWSKTKYIRANQAVKPCPSAPYEHGQTHIVETLLEKLSCLEVVLKWYATGQHLVGLNSDWESISGEPQHWFCGPGSVMVEDGGLARAALNSPDGKAEADDTGPGLDQRDDSVLLSLLKEVSASFTRDDDLPDRLLSRIDLAIREYERAT